MLVTNPTSVRYLTGFVSSNATLLVEQDRVRLYTDFRYATAARAVDGVEFVETARFVLGELASRLDGRFVVESDHLTVSQADVLRGGGLELVPQRGLVEELRAVKDAGEVDAIRRACAISDEAYATLAEEPFVGRTERELAWTMERLLREGGGERLSFEVAVGSGANGALPHADPGDRVVRPDELVVVDAGCVVDGYCSDCTRTFATGELPAELRRIYDICLEAQARGLEAVEPGAYGPDVDAAAREVISAAGYGEAFGHGLGHGVGLALHEAPVLRPESRDTLAPGHCVTVEPGIYLPGAAGVRIEDLVAVTETGCEVLTHSPKELVVVG
jgi:Xaa-Pro aminopeptidase